MERLIVAHTDTKFGDYPSFINVYEAKHDGVVINIRSERNPDGTQGSCATIDLDTSALLELLPAIINRLGWLPGWVAKYNATEKRKEEIAELERIISNAEQRLTAAIIREDRIEKGLESWYQP